MSLDTNMMAFDQQADSLIESPVEKRLEVQCEPLAALVDHVRDNWRDLLHRSLVENPFLHPTLVKAGIDNGLNGSENRAVVVSLNGQIEGVFPSRPAHIRGISIPAAVTTELNLYHFNGAPLVSQNKAPEILRAWLNAFGTNDTPHAWIMRNVDLEGEFASIVSDIANEIGYGFHAIPRHQRRRLTREFGGFDEHVKAVFSKNRIQGVRRNIRRLSEQGDVRFERAVEKSLVAKRVEEFLHLEASGWKGEAETAFLNSPSSAAYARAAYATEGDEGVVSTNALLLNDTPIALSVNLQAGNVRFTPKSAFNEEYRKFSPGVILRYRVIEAFYKEHTCELMDSATTVSANIHTDIWNKEVRHGDVIIAKSPLQANVIALAFNGFENAKPFLKRLRDKIT
ncbi:MAG: GNAT family N-acetyltransferase [Pseudomonadota bacterium]